MPAAGAGLCEFLGELLGHPVDEGAGVAHYGGAQVGELQDDEGLEEALYPRYHVVQNEPARALFRARIHYRIRSIEVFGAVVSVVVLPEDFLIFFLTIFLLLGLLIQNEGAVNFG